MNYESQSVTLTEDFWGKCWWLCPLERSLGSNKGMVGEWFPGRGVRAHSGWGEDLQWKHWHPRYLIGKMGEGKRLKAWKFKSFSFQSREFQIVSTSCRGIFGWSWRNASNISLLPQCKLGRSKVQYDSGRARSAQCEQWSMRFCVGQHNLCESWGKSMEIIWGFPKIGVPPNHPF